MVKVLFGVRVVVLWIVLVVLVAALHLAVGRWPLPATLATCACWWGAGLLFGHAVALRGWRTAWRVFALATTAALVAVIAIGVIVARSTYWREVPLATIGALVLACELTALPMVWLGARAGAWTLRRAYRRWAVRAMLVAGAAGVVWSAYAYLRDLGLVGYESADRIVAFDRLVRTLDSYYSHWSYSPVSEQEMVARWRPRIVEASRACTSDPCRPYLIALRAMLAELGDIHTRLGSDALPRPAGTAVSTSLVDGELVVTGVRAGSDAERAGVRPGAIIRTIDGRPPADAMAAVPAWLVAFSAETTRSVWRAAHVLDGPIDESAAVELDGAGRIVLARERTPSPAFDARFVAPGVLVIGIHGLTDPSIVGAFDRALDQPGVRALIIDLRGNGGGNSALGNAMVGRLVDRGTKYGRECLRAHPIRLWIGGCGDLVVQPRGTHFAGPVAALLDAGVVSSGEWLAAALCDTGRARCFGRTTAGGSGNPVPFRVPGGFVQYSTGNATRLDGSPFESRGVPPHVAVTWHRDDLIAGRDPDLDAARQWLGVR